MSKLFIRFSPSFVIFLLFQGEPVGADIVSEVAETRANTLEALQLRETLAREQRAWREQQDLMEGQLRLDQQALAQLERELAQVEPQLAALLSESSRLSGELEASTAVITFWRGKLEILKRRLAVIVSRFPPQLKNRLSGKLRDAESIKYSEDTSRMKRAFDLCLEVISEANEFHREVHLLTELHELADGKQGEFSVVYLGLSGGYYFSEKSQSAGMIQWSGDAWKWKEDVSLLDDLLIMKAVLQGEETPRFMKLPFEFVKEVNP